MKYIIMCGGTYPAWEKPRQLTQIHGETLVGRTIRLLREAGVYDIAISSNNAQFSNLGVPVLRHNNSFKAFTIGGGSWAECFYPTEEPACYIMGDVVFSPEAIKTIVRESAKDIMFFASAPPFHPSYIKQYAEPFAFKVYDQKRFRKAVDFVIANENTGIFARRPIAWELWQVINGEDVRQINFTNYCVINDYTCDIDNPEDAEKIRRIV